MKGRRRARRTVLELLFQLEFRRVTPEALLEELCERDPFVCEVLQGIQAHRDELDRLIAERAAGWPLERLVSVDRNVLRLGLYELLYTDTPAEVAINEAVELAKRYGTERSAAFVNGVLDRFWKERQGLQLPT